MIVLMTPAMKAQEGPGAAPPPVPASAPKAPQTQTPTTNASRGKRLYLKNGSYELVRDYQVLGDRVRYYSLDSLQWEEVPASMVDWDATKKEAAKEQQEEAALLKKAEHEQMEQNAEPLDIDASIQIAPKVFLPDGAGLFVFDGGKLQRMAQANTEGNVNKEKLIEQVLIPIPIVPTRHEIFIAGARAKLRLPPSEPEFYIRTTEPDEPELELVKAKVKKDKRHIENLDEMLGGREEIRNLIPIHIMQMAQGVYRVTVEKDLAPGEYAVLEVLRGPDGQAAEQRGETNLYVWDFGLDAAGEHPAEK